MRATTITAPKNRSIRYVAGVCFWAMAVIVDEVPCGRGRYSRKPFRLRAPERVEKCSWECFREGTKSRPVVVPHTATSRKGIGGHSVCPGPVRLHIVEGTRVECVIADRELERWIGEIRREPDAPLSVEGLRAPRLRPKGPEVAAVTDLVVGTALPCPGRLYFIGMVGAPFVLYVHGGGFVFGDLESHDRVCRRLAVEGEVNVLAVDYRCAPESPAPAAVDDIEAALDWLFEHHTGAQIGLAGDSAGGLIGFLAVRRMVDKGRSLAGQLLLNPNADLTLSSPSVQSEGCGWGLSAVALHWFVAQWLPRATASQLAEFSPIVHSAVGMPPTLLVTSEHDPLRDEGFELGEVLRVGGALAEHRHLDGMVHGFVNLDLVSPTAKFEGDQIFREFGALLRAQKCS